MQAVADLENTLEELKILGVPAELRMGLAVMADSDRAAAIAEMQRHQNKPTEKGPTETQNEFAPTETDDRAAMQAEIQRRNEEEEYRRDMAEEYAEGLSQDPPERFDLYQWYLSPEMLTSESLLDVAGDIEAPEIEAQEVVVSQSLSNLFNTMNGFKAPEMPADTELSRASEQEEIQHLVLTPDEELAKLTELRTGGLIYPGMPAEELAVLAEKTGIDPKKLDNYMAEHEFQTAEQIAEAQKPAEALTNTFGGSTGIEADRIAADLYTKPPATTNAGNISGAFLSAATGQPVEAPPAPTKDLEAELVAEAKPLPNQVFTPGMGGGGMAG